MRLIQNFIRLKELTAEDEYRKSKGLPSKEDESPYDILEKYKDDPMVMISFKSEYYFKTKRLGVNLDTEKIYSETPNGIYCYPLNIIWETFDHKERKLQKIPFVGNSKSTSIVILRLKGRGLNLNNYSEQQYDNDLSILKNKYSDSDISDIEESIKKTYSKGNYYYNNFGFYLWKIIKTILVKTNFTKLKVNIWNLTFSRDLGYNWVLDEGDAIIHSNEPTQCVIFKNEAYDLIDSIDISKINFESSKEDLNLYNKLYDYIRKMHVSNKLDIDNIKGILSKYPDIVNYKKNQNSLLYLSCKDDDFDLVELLLKQPNIDVNSKNHIDRFTPLYIACYTNNIEIVKLLLEHPKIDVNSYTKRKMTPLHLACQKNNIEVVKLLLENPNININIMNKNMDTPLSLTTNPEIKELLIQHGAIE